MSDPANSSQPTDELRFKGIPASPGVASGPLVIYRPDEQVVRKRKIRPEDVGQEISRFEQALIQTRHQIQHLRARLTLSLGEKDASVFDAHLLVVEDPTILNSVRDQLQQKLVNVDYLYWNITKSYAQQLKDVDDDYLSERAQDILDVGRRVLRNLQGLNALHTLELDTPSIIFAHDLTPSDTATFDRTKVLGFVTEVGSRTSHTAIMARSLNIPAIVGVRDIDLMLEPGVETLVDGYEGTVVFNPNDKTKFEYGRIESRRHEVEVKLETLRETLAVTTDQRRVIVSANVELPEDLQLIQENGAEGIGLYRTEFLFLNRDDFPTEDEQTQVYRQVALAAKPHSIIIRTLDVGGDKNLPHLGIEPETNPFLGWRGIRFCLGREAEFRTQLRAIARASVEGNVRVMFPMITEIGEIRRARQLLSEEMDNVRKQGLAVPEKIETGIMVEVPSAAMMADLFAPEVDFFSIGTNDLIQYTLAVDRGNEKVSNLYQPTHPAILRLIHGCVQAARRANIWVGICGEMASDLALTPMLVGLGVDELSLGSVFVPRVKRAVQALNYIECQAIVADLMNQASAEDNLVALEAVARRLYPEIL